jgi:DmsE family decaheme c-type cytochrome
VQITQKVIVAAAILLGSWAVAAQAADPIRLPALGAPQQESVSAAQSSREHLAQDAKCTRCHDENESKPVLAFFQTPMGVTGDPRTPTCESCHGPSLAHLRGPVNGKIAPPDVVFNRTGPYSESSAANRAEACLACHSGTQRTHWEGSPHQVNGLACNDCHKVHAAVDPVRTKGLQQTVCYTCHKDRRADFMKLSHHPVPEGKMMCSDCHNPHGSVGPFLMKKATINETCWTCHADKRGPFLWEHEPVTEKCTNCHNPHGSNIAPLLKARPPFLCQECHDGPHQSKNMFGPGVAGPSTATGFSAIPGSPAAGGVGEGCMNCHIMVHGSNNPAGAYLQR